MKRFSKMVSVMKLMPCAKVIQAMYCACRSVAKPGYSSVDIDGFGRAADLTRTAAASSNVGAGLSQFDLRRNTVGNTVADYHFAVGDRAGENECSRFNAVGDDGVLGAVQFLDALHVMMEVPAPSIRAPILTSRSARSLTSGSRAALRITVSPLARTAAIKMSFGPGDGDAVEMNVAALQPFRRTRFNVSVALVNLRTKLFQG